MKVVAAVLLAALGGNTSPFAEDINAILASVGVEADEEKVEKLLGQLKGRDLAEVIAVGREKFASVPTGGGVAVAVAGAGGAAAPVAAPEAEAKKEEKVEEKEESDEDMGFSLFD